MLTGSEQAGREDMKAQYRTSVVMSRFWILGRVTMLG